jgi:hypothetical protein
MPEVVFADGEEAGTPLAASCAAGRATLHVSRASPTVEVDRAVGRSHQDIADTAQQPHTSSKGVDDSWREPPAEEEQQHASGSAGGEWALLDHIVFMDAEARQHGPASGVQDVAETAAPQPCDELAVSWLAEGSAAGAAMSEEDCVVYADEEPAGAHAGSPSSWKRIHCAASPVSISAHAAGQEPRSGDRGAHAGPHADAAPVRQQAQPRQQERKRKKEQLRDTMILVGTSGDIALLGLVGTLWTYAQESGMCMRRTC